ncbi:MAG: winged helix-turn-helix domain-containing protein [Vulcanisaeta sp.]|jgi:hypothetical protein|nr:MAG: ArsR family transcriptional regulator [Vulcanisaeta sp. CIS_19]MCG2867321.1 winged helix-turn-helix domain-containing protein [Vulcanisaeta sp.]MCG2885912.1 winged helix-turn-helix domain-containing protein [Vulcanisaeta sp.]
MNVVTKPEIIVSINEKTGKVPDFSDDYVLMREKEFNAVLDGVNLSIILAIMRGHTHFVELMRETGLQKGKLARRLKRLLDSGWITKEGNKYLVSGRIFVVYDIGEINGNITIHISTDKGAFADPVYGLVVISGEPRNYCSTCPLRQACVNNVKSMARKYGVQLRGVEPSEAYVELFRVFVERDLTRKLRSGWRIIIKKGEV